MTPELLCPRWNGIIAAERCCQAQDQDRCACPNKCDLTIATEITQLHLAHTVVPTLPKTKDLCKICGARTRAVSRVCNTCAPVAPRDCRWCGKTFTPTQREFRGQYMMYCSPEHKALRLASNPKGKPLSDGKSWGWTGA